MYAKLFASLYQGTLRGCADELLVFTNLLAHSDAFGVVDKHWRAIAEECGIPRDRVEAAIANLEAPDPDSRSPEEEGRRIVRMDEHRVWGWRIVNYCKYRSIRNEDDRREQNRLAQERWRLRNKQSKQSKQSKQNKQSKPRSAQAEAEAEAEEEATKKDHSVANAPQMPGKRGTRLMDDWKLTDELRAFAINLGLDPAAERDSFVDYWTSVPGSKGLKLDWGKTFKNRCREVGRRGAKAATGETFDQRRIREAREAVK